MMSRWYQPVFRTRLALHRHSVQEFITTRQGIADLARHHLNFAGMELPRGNDLRALGRMAWGPEVRIAFAPAESQQTFGSSQYRRLLIRGGLVLPLPMSVEGSVPRSACTADAA